jgi:hypothetical protein
MFDNAQIFSLRVNERHLSSHFERMSDVRIPRFKRIMQGELGRLEIESDSW